MQEAGRGIKNNEFWYADRFSDTCITRYVDRRYSFYQSQMITHELVLILQEKALGIEFGLLGLWYNIELSF